MAFSPEDLLGTPSGYATPDQLASVQQYANLLMKGGQRDKEITSPWQGLRMMADTLSGNIMRNRAGQQQMGNTAMLGNAQADVEGQTFPQPGQPAQTPSQAVSSAQATAGGMDPQTARTFKLESGNDPNARTGSNVGLGQFGPQEMQRYGITNPSDPGQQISAMHQETAGNTAALTKALGRQPTPGEIYLAHQQGLAGATALLTNPNVPAWQAVRKFYPSDAVAQKAIAGNPPGGGHFDPNAPAGAFTGAWVKQFEGRMPQGGQSADLSGSIGGQGAPPAGSPAAMAGALQGGSQNTQMAAGAARPAGGGAGGAEPPPAQVGNPTMGAQYMERRPQITQDNLRRMLTNPILDDASKQRYIQMFEQQNQPNQAAGPGGHWIMPGSGQGQPLWVPDLQKFEEEAAGAKTTTMGTIQPGQGGQFGFQGLPGASGVGGQPASQPQPPQAPSGAQALPGGSPDAPPTPLGVTPPGAPPQSGQPAQAGDTGSRLNALANFGLDVKNREQLNTKDAELYSKNNDATLSAGTQANQGLPLIQMAKQAVQDPNFYSGIGADAVVDFKRLKAALGDNPNAAAANEVFEKFMAGDVLSQLRSKLQGLGQVRLAEIDLLSRATGNRYNTPAANMAVLNVIERSYNQMAALTKVANDYRANTRVPTNTGLNEAINAYLKANPTFQPDEIKDFNKTLDLDSKAGKPKTSEDKIGDFFSKRPPGQPAGSSIDDKLNAAKQRLQQMQGQ